MEQEQTTKNTIEWNGKIIKIHKGINTKELIQDVIGKEDNHVYHHNQEYRNRKRQIVRWAKKYDAKVKDYINELAKQPLVIKGTYKEHDYIIYLSDYGYCFHTEINCLRNEIGGVEFNIFWKEDSTSSHVGDYGNSHRDGATYYKDTHTINWSQDTKITKPEEIYYKFKDEEGKEKEKETGEKYHSRSYGGLVTIHEVEPTVHKIIDDFIKRQENGFKERALEFRRIHHQLKEIKKQFVATPDEDYQPFNCFDRRFKEQKGRTEETTNAISKNVYDKLFTFFNDMPLSVQNTFYKDAIGLMSACIVAKAEENHNNLDGLRKLREELEELK